MTFDSAALLAALDDIGQAALDNSSHLELAIYGGSALMIAGNFRFATEDVDIAEIKDGQPQWFSDIIGAIATKNGWSSDWINDAVQFHLSPLADRATDHVEFGSFPRGQGPYGLDVVVPTAEYIFALKLKAIRLLDPNNAEQEAADILNLAKVIHADTIERAIAVLAKYFPKTAKSPEKQVYLLKHLTLLADPHHAPRYLGRSGPTDTRRRDQSQGNE
ncbi:MAG: hypothetical protein FWD68_08380 [Alphaproteobacteria bacterium]|nr:hypothetical protein [Alphaproteobacteria bacterium]